jgi:hypothetical protein
MHFYTAAMATSRILLRLLTWFRLRLMAGRGTNIVLGGNVEKQWDLVEADEKLPPERKEIPGRQTAGPAYS